MSSAVMTFQPGSWYVTGIRKCVCPYFQWFVNGYKEVTQSVGKGGNIWMTTTTMMMWIGGHGGETWGTRTYRSGWYHSIGALQFLIVMGAMGCYGMLGCEKAQAIHSLEHGRVEVSGKFAKVNHIQNYSYNFIHGSSEHCDFVQAWTNRVGEIGSIWFACCGQLINAWVQT